MEEFTNPAKSLHARGGAPVLILVERQLLMRSCILRILHAELTELEIVELEATNDLYRVLGRNVRLIALNIGDRSVVDPSIEDDLANVKEMFPNVAVALLSNREGEAAAAMQRGVRGFFSTSIPVEVAIAGLRLVLAGGVYRPLPLDRATNDPPVPTIMTKYAASPKLADVGGGVGPDVMQSSRYGLTPRELDVLGALSLGLPNKLIAAKLNLSENTVKMHIQRIMRKCSARNRTEAVLLWSDRLSGNPRRALVREFSPL
jgi:DNA-binding NarL/FixJ family response regulator